MCLQLGVQFFDDACEEATSFLDVQVPVKRDDGEMYRNDLKWDQQ